jgi:DNA-binding NarL/FixJ family response regulator
LIVRQLVAVSAEQAASLGLTGRQADVLPALMEGATNEEIAMQLGLSPRTVQKHVAGIMRALGVHTRTAAAARARDVLGG